MKNRLKEAREICGISQVELSEITGISRTTISKIECNEAVDLKASTIVAISNALNLPITEIFLI